MNRKHKTIKLTVLVILMLLVSVSYGQEENIKEKKNQKSRLAQAIERIRMAKVESKPIVIEEEQVEENQDNQDADEAKTQNDKSLQGNEETQVISADHNKSELTKEIMDKVQAMMAEPSKSAYPDLLAEVLFECGKLKEAYIFYKETLRRLDEKPDSIDAPKDWILFQTANCIRKENKTEAINLYKRLLNETPESDWIGFTRTQIKLLSWYIDNHVEDLVLAAKETESEL